MQFLLFESDARFVKCFSHLFTREEVNAASSFSKDLLREYLTQIKYDNKFFEFIQGPVNTDEYVRKSKMATFTGTKNPFMVIRNQCTPKEYKAYWRKMLENKEIDKFLEQ